MQARSVLEARQLREHPGRELLQDAVSYLVAYYPRTLEGVPLIMSLSPKITYFFPRGH